ncbi:MAG: hypothetical protein ABIX12_07630 [Rubrivivax sp.]
MNEIVASVQRVSDIIGEISAAASEQRAGIVQVGGAVSELDRMTQQNAALVEQSAAAAQSLEEQAQRLVQAAASFRLAPRGSEAARQRGTRTARPGNGDTRRPHPQHRCARFGTRLEPATDASPIRRRRRLGNVLRRAARPPTPTTSGDPAWT